VEPSTCRAEGETFVARDTLIEAITLWRWASQYNDVTPWQLFILGMTHGHPDPFNVVLTGPVLVNEFGDRVHPVEFRFAFDPPFALPASGTYFFCIKEITGFSSIPIVADTTDSYREGQVWRIGPTVDCVGFGGVTLESPPTIDLVFTIDFCSTATPAQRPTWGQLKAQYRK
jgi:hypothetical protein